MHLVLAKALAAVISASVVAVGVALAPVARDVQHAHGSTATTRARTLEKDGLAFLRQVAAGNVKPDAALKQVWTYDVNAVAHSLGLTDRALVHQITAGRSLDQIAASRGVPSRIATTALLRHIRANLGRAEHDRAISRTAARALINALSTALGNP